MRLETKQLRLNARAHAHTGFARESNQALKVIAATGFAFFILATLASCAGGPSPGASLENTIAASKTPTTQPPTTTGSTSMSQTANAQETGEFDCGRLTGRMQVRILQIRDYSPATKTSGLSRSLHGLSKSMFGGTNRGLDPDAQHHADVALLRSQNENLAKHGCKTFDLDTELKPSAISHTPSPR